MSLSTGTSNGNRYSANNRADKATAIAMARVKCRICYDSGKGSDMYENHRIREVVNGRIRMCPTLANLTCQSCGAKGHTPSRCPAAICRPVVAHVVRDVVSEKKATNVRAVPPTPRGEYANAFAGLEDDSSDEEIDSIESIEPIANTQKASASTYVSWYDSDDEE